MSLPPPVEEHARDDAEHYQPPIFLLSGNVFKDLICSFLEPDEIVELLKVSELPFLLGDRFCRTHGTTLDRDESSRVTSRNEQNDDIAFLIWCLEREKFFSEEENEELPSTNPDCIDCRKARFEGLKKCKKCDEYEDHEEFFTCSGTCQRGECCTDCQDGMWQCPLCENQEPFYCWDCFFDGSRYYCEGCDKAYCRSCRMEYSCSVCGEGSCEECYPSAGMFTCGECMTTSCFDCRDFHFCDICSEFFCNECRPGFWCERCNKSFCLGRHRVNRHACDQCGVTMCSACNDSSECQKCHERRCMDCRYSFECGKCNGEFCENCQKSNYCELCTTSFCTSCKDGFHSYCDWACVDCLDKLESERNGDECANCFLSEDDMEGVKLKKCSNCKTTKYCSKACQRAHWPEHRDKCRSVSKANSETE